MDQVGQLLEVDYTVLLAQYHKVYALEIIGNDVYAGGQFTIAGGQSAKKIAKWNGSEWSGF